MNLLDWLLVVLALVYALSGYWQGFVTGAFSTAGLLIGLVLGVLLAPRVLAGVERSLLVSMAALLILILCASLGQAVLQYGGVRVRDRITWQPARAVDAVGGAALSAAAVLVVAWAIGVAVSSAGIPGVTPVVRGSAILERVDDALPSSANRLLNAFTDVVDTTFFPRYLEPFAPERIVEVGPGPRRLLSDPDVQAASGGVLKIRGENACGRGVEGSGFLYADDRLMTNAHVVAAVDSPRVELGDDTVPASVVYYNPDLDVAVLALDDGGRAPLALGFDAGRPDGVAVLGYPQDGPYDVQPGRIRSEQRLRSPDIYGDGTVVREVFAIRALVRPGNSGGPIVDSAGRAVGLIFAASVTDQQTGYALTGDQIRESAAQGAASRGAVGTGRCTG